MLKKNILFNNNFDLVKKIMFFNFEENQSFSELVEFLEINKNNNSSLQDKLFEYTKGKLNPLIFHPELKIFNNFFLIDPKMKEFFIEKLKLNKELIKYTSFSIKIEENKMRKICFLIIL